MQMDDQYPHEAAAPLIPLACAWPHDGAARLRAGGPSLQQLLEQLLGLCGAQRGALLLPRAPSVALAVAAFSPSAPLAGFRTLATRGMGQEDLLPLLAALALAGADGQIPAETAGWMFCHLPMAAPVRSSADPIGLLPAEPSYSAQFPADALLVFGREARDAHLSLAVHEQGGALLPQISGLATLLLSNHLLQECLEEREGQRPRLTAHEREMLRIELRASVSHALRSPLTAIKGSAETLLRLEQRIGQPERREFLRTITQASDELAAVVEYLLNATQ